MSKIKLKRSVLRGATFLTQRGYRYQPDESNVSIVLPFRKQPVDGIQCTISFQLRQHYIPPVREFTVWLSRKYLPKSFPTLRIQPAFQGAAVIFAQSIRHFVLKIEFAGKNLGGLHRAH